jgi:dynein heavy chain
LFQIPRDVKHKLVYFAKKMTENMGESDFSQTILFGEIPRSLLTHVTAFLDEVLVCL